MYIKENVNPKGWKCGDCVVRACAKATNKSWDDTYNALYEIGFKKKRMLNDDCVYCKFLEDNGFTYTNAYRDGYNKMVDVHTLAEYLNDQCGDTHYVAVVHTRKHLTCIVDGDIYDSWNTSYETAGWYYLQMIEGEE